MEDNTKRTIGIIGTVVTTLCCGCMGLYSLLSGAMIISGDTSLFVNTNTGREIDSISDGRIRLYLGLFMIAVPAVIAYFTFRSRGGGKKTDTDIDEPIPPAI